MKKYLIYLFTLASTLLIGCDSFRDMSGTAEVNPITVDVYLDITVENISTLKDLTVKFDNYDEDLHYVKEVTDNSVKVDGIIPGIYSVTVSGTAIDTENNEYYINGNSVNAAFSNRLSWRALSRLPRLFFSNSSRSPSNSTHRPAP